MLPQVWLYTDAMEVAGDLVQDLATYLAVEQLPSTCHFPGALQTFKETLDKVGDQGLVLVTSLAGVGPPLNLLNYAVKLIWTEYALSKGCKETLRL